MTVYSVCLCLWLLDSTLWVIPFDLPLTAINPSNPLRCPLVALLPGLACLSPTSLYCFSQLPNNRKPSSHQLNNIGFMQEQDLVKPYQAVSYHFAVPFIGDFVGVAERVRRVSSEDELRQALAARAGLVGPLTPEGDGDGEEEGAAGNEQQKQQPPRHPRVLVAPRRRARRGVQRGPHR